MFLFHIQYQTAEVIPPPYAHAIEVSGRSDGAGALDINFSLEYLGREQLDEQEIVAEGFSLNDDFVWEGKLPTVWLEILFGSFKTLKPANKTEISEQEDFWLLDFEDNKSYPQDTESWKTLLQELQQAIFEAAQREQPLAISYLSIDNKGKRKVEIEASFVERRAGVSQRMGFQRLDWDELHKILLHVYRLDFLPESAWEREPHKAGEYLNLGDGLWYELGKSAIGTKKHISQVVKVLGEFV